VEEVEKVATGWILGMSGREGDGRVKLPIGIPIPGATTVNRVNGNLRQVELDEA
jgi:hypothetical protein